MLLKRIICSCFIFSGLFTQSAFSQFSETRFRDATNSFSNQMKGGSQIIQLLTLPSDLDGNRDAWNRSLGGISGSSFDTQVATPDQVHRSFLRASTSPVFNAPSAFEIYNRPSTTSFTDQPETPSLEMRFSKSDFNLDDSFSKYSAKLDRAFSITGGRHRSKILDSLFSE